MFFGVCGFFGVFFFVLFCFLFLINGGAHRKCIVVLNIFHNFEKEVIKACDFDES